MDMQLNKGEKHLARMPEVQEHVPEGSASHRSKGLPQRETSAGNIRSRNRYSMTISLQFILLGLTLKKKIHLF